jgi:hypothetical protein
MGFVTQFFIKPRKPALLRQPSGSFTVDRDGKVITSTLPRTYLPANMQTIAKRVLASFAAAKKAEIKISELSVEFAEIKVVARDMRGGAIIYLEPQAIMAGVQTVEPGQLEESFALDSRNKA